MRARFVTVTALAVALLVCLASPRRALAGHHLWRFTQLFSNAGGTTQFMQLFTADAGEPGVGPFTITSGGNVFNFVTNLPSSSTANTWILIATSNFGSLPGGVTPDYIIPAHFFPTGGGSLNYAGVDTWSYGALPTDGVNALMRSTGTAAVNSPTNFAGQTGAVHLVASVPALPTPVVILLVGALLLLGSGLIRRRNAGRTTAP